MHPPPATPAEDRIMAAGIATVWMWTGLAVLHPYFLEVGVPYLTGLGLPAWLAPATCAGEVALGLWVLARPPDRLSTALQLGAVGFFTLALAAQEPALLAHPFGVLTKNLPFATLVVARLLAAEEGWTRRARGVLRGGVAAIWVTEGVFPKILFQGDFERAVVARSGLVPIDPGTFLVILGAAQALSGLVVAADPPRLGRLVLGAQAVALVVLPLLVAWQDPRLWVHPFAPLVKNAAILAGTLVLMKEEDR